MLNEYRQSMTPVTPLKSEPPDIVVRSQRDKVDLGRLYMNGVAHSDAVTAQRAALAERPADA